MAKPFLPLFIALAVATPSLASAEIVRADFRGETASLILVGDDDDRRRYRRDRRDDRRDYRRDRREARRDYREGYRDGRRYERRDRDYRPGYDRGRRYSRGQYLPAQYRGYVIDDYRRYGYPPPPRGCRYVRVGQDTYLTQIATGLILNAFLGGGY